MLKSMAMNEYLEFSHSWVFLLKTNKPWPPLCRVFKAKNFKNSRSLLVSILFLPQPLPHTRSWDDLT